MPRGDERGPATLRRAISRTRPREYEEIDTYIRREERGARPDFLREDHGRNDGPMVLRGRERESETFQRRRPRSISRERVSTRDPSPATDRLRARIIEQDRSPPPPGRLRARVIETRERVRARSPTPSIRRARSVSPPAIDRVRIIERQEARQTTPSPPPSPPPIHAPPIHQEIITHHRHINHGFEPARAPSPSVRRSETRTNETDIDIYTSRNNTEVDITRRNTAIARPRTPQPRRGDFYDDTILYEGERDKVRTQASISRRRSLSAFPERPIHSARLDRRDDQDEADYYARKTDERACIGEAWNGATKDWSIIDVPPGTERVIMDGVGGGSQEVTWQKYNGVRRSKFIPEREEGLDYRTSDPEIAISHNRRREGSALYEREYERIEETSNRRAGTPRGAPNQRVGDLWTEITKDLVCKEAIIDMGYDFEETEYFYYIIQYLCYDDVLELVRLSDYIRQERQQRIREIERERRYAERRQERDEWERRERRRDSYGEERILEREVIYENGRRRRY